MVDLKFSYTARMCRKEKVVPKEKSDALPLKYIQAQEQIVKELGAKVDELAMDYFKKVKDQKKFTRALNLSTTLSGQQRQFLEDARIRPPSLNKEMEAMAWLAIELAQNDLFVEAYNAANDVLKCDLPPPSSDPTSSSSPSSSSSSSLSSLSSSSSSSPPCSCKQVSASASSPPVTKCDTCGKCTQCDPGSSSSSSSSGASSTSCGECLKKPHPSPAEHSTGSKSSKAPSGTSESHDGDSQPRRYAFEKLFKQGSDLWEYVQPEPQKPNRKVSTIA
jgi:CCR4-NOT transcriptional regulation complex NOT5 subunit